MCINKSWLIQCVPVVLVLASLSAFAPASAQNAHHHEHAAHTEAARGSAENIKRTILQITIPGLRLLREDNVRQDLREAIGSGGPVFVNFIFTSCTTVCPVMSETFARLAEETAKAGKPLRLISISIDPEVDTPARLGAYAAQFGAPAGWRFLTGTPAESKAAQTAFGLDIVDKMSHPVATFYYPGTGTQWTRIDGFVAPAELAALVPAVAVQHSHRHHH